MDVFLSAAKWCLGLLSDKCIYLSPETLQPELNNLGIFRFTWDAWSYTQKQGCSFWIPLRV